MATTLGTAYVQIVPSAKGIKGSIESALGGEAESAGKSAGGKISGAIGGALSGVGSVLKVGFGAAMAGVTAATGAVTVFGKEAIDSYASYEQLVGGVEKLYGDAAGKIQQFADDAYKTSGMSANKYMETATQFSASLVNSLGGDVDKAAEMTDVAMRAMSDNVNVFGSDAQSVQNAFLGLAKQNYSMVDNLKLGYGGSRAEVERLIKDANEWGAANGKASDLSIDSFADVITAIQQIQEKQNIAGTTAKEAMSTIEGSATAVKSAWENVITAVGRGEGLQQAFDGLASSLFGGESGGGLLNQIIPRIQTTMEGIGQFVATAAPYISNAIPELITAVVPSLIQGGITLLSALGSALMDNIDVLLFAAGDIIEMLMNAMLEATSGESSTVVEIINWILGVFSENYSQLLDVGAQILLNIVNGIISSLPDLLFYATEIISSFGQMLIDNAPLLISACATLISTLATGIADALPTLIPLAVELLMTIVTALVDPANIGILMQGAVDLVMGLTNGIIAALPVLLEALPVLVSQVCAALTGDNLQLLLQAVVDVTIALAQAILENLPLLIDVTIQIIIALVGAIISAAPQFLSAVGELLLGIGALIVQYGGQFISKAGEVCGNIITAIVNFLSQLPSKMAYWAGYAIGQFIKFFLELPSKIATIWNNVITGAAAFVTNFKNKGVESAKGFFTSIIDGIKELPTKVIEIGSNIVKGIWQGISDGWTWLTDSIKGLAESLLGGVKDALGIESPSKEFAWVGKMVDEGFAKGLTDNAYLVDEAMSSLDPTIKGGTVYSTFDNLANGQSSDQITINVYPSAGMDEKALAREINYRLAEQTNRKYAAWRPAYV